ncbi:MAG: hypothetical protein ACRELE_01465 [Gemmatimonadales bacterium]
MALALLMASPVRAQSVPYPLNLSGATFLEQVHSDVITQSGRAERHRTIDRSARYTTMKHGDTLLVSADSIRLDETADGVRRAVDVDAVIGGRWTLMIDPRGATSVMEAPFVPGDVADVSDLSLAMDDFFPLVPPPLQPGVRSADSLRRVWRRLADSAGEQRYRWSERRHHDGTTTGADSVQVEAVSEVQEDGDAVWNVARGPLGWTRHIQTTVTSRFAGRTVRAVVDQRVVVRRVT